MIFSIVEFVSTYVKEEDKNGNEVIIVSKLRK